MLIMLVWTIHGALTMRSCYGSAIATDVIQSVMAKIASFPVIFEFIICMCACSFQWKSALLNADWFSQLIVLGTGTHSPFPKIWCHSAILNPVVGLGHGLVGYFTLCVQSWTDSHHQATVGVGYSLGSRCYCDCCLTCSLGLGFGCSYSRLFSGLPPCIVSAWWEASRPLPSCLAVLSLSSFLHSWAIGALSILGWPSTIALISTWPAPHSMLSLLELSHAVFQFSSHYFIMSHSVITCAMYTSSTLAIL